MVLFWIILFLIIISNDGSASLQKRKRNCGSLLFVICTVGQLFTKQLVLTIWKKRNEIITIVDKGEYQKLMKYINQEDPEAFITVYTVSDMRYLPKK